MEIEYNTSVPSSESYFALFETTGWNHKYQATPADLMSALSASQFVISAYDDGRLAGFGRVVTDGILHAMIYDMIVHPDYQGHGIGTIILQRLVKWCKERKIRDIQLFCAQGKIGFYGRNGFIPRPADAPGMSYMPQ